MYRNLFLEKAFCLNNETYRAKYQILWLSSIFFWVVSVIGLIGAIELFDQNVPDWGVYVVSVWLWLFYLSIITVRSVMERRWTYFGISVYLWVVAICAGVGFYLESVGQVSLLVAVLIIGIPLAAGLLTMIVGIPLYCARDREIYNVM